MSKLAPDQIERLIADLRRQLEVAPTSEPSSAIALLAELSSALGVGESALVRNLSLRRLATLAEVGRIAAETIHELRQPLVALKAYTEMFPEFAGDEAWVKQTAALMLTEARRMEDMITRVQRFGRAPLGRHAIDLNDPARAAGELLRPIFRQKRVQLEEKYAATLPAVSGETGALQQILINLLGNAAQSVPDAGRGRVSVRTLVHEGNVRCEIEDNGGGVPAELRDRIFEPFFTTRPPGEGNGLGLAISRAIAEEHGGTLEIVDLRAGSTTFRLSLPIA